MDDFKLRNVVAMQPGDMGKAVAEAVHSNDTDALKKAVKGMAMLFTDTQVKNAGGLNHTLEQVVDSSFKLSGSEGKAILPGDVDQMKAMLPALRNTFKDDPAALLVLDKMQAFDFREAHIGDLNKNLSGLRNVNDVDARDAMGTFLRGNPFFSAAMKADQLRTFDPVAFGKSMVEKHMGRLSVVVEMATVQNERDDYQTKLTSAFIQLGMPVVGVD